MLYIRKEPPSPEVAQEISRVKRDVQWKQSGQPDSAYARTAFNLFVHTVCDELKNTKIYRIWSLNIGCP